MKDSDDKDSGATANPTATALALAQASREKADAFLDKQSALADLQIADLKREDSVRHWSLRVRHISDVLRLTLELTAALVILGVAALLGTAVYQASQDNSLAIESFSVPPDLAARGLTGQAVAAQLQDKLSAMQEATDSSRPPDSYANNWGSDIKVQIPDTGVSVGEFYRMLVLWFGHQTHITGEVFHTATQGTVQGVAITVRASGSSGDTVKGSADDLDGLLQQAAEAVYARTQTYRYGIYVIQQSQQKDRAKGDAIFQQLVASGSVLDRAWSYMAIGTRAEYQDPLHAPQINKQAMPLAPGFALPYQNVYSEERVLGHDEAALGAARQAIALLGVDNGEVSPRAANIMAPTLRAGVAEFAGDFGGALQENRAAALLPNYSGLVIQAQIGIANNLAQLHEAGAARRSWSAIAAPKNPVGQQFRDLFAIALRDALQDWDSIPVLAAEVESQIRALENQPPFAPAYAPATLPRRVWPYQALALAHTGDMGGALALIGKTPRDCYICVRMRGRIDAMRRNWNGAEGWFALAVHQAPSLPFAETEWGQMLLAKGDRHGAIAKFAAANTKGPHFADPLELWGEALMAQNRSDLALAKFTEAAKYAPNWGRLHLKWGEALVWSGQKDEAKKELARAAKLDLSAAEKSELARFR